MRVKNIQCQLSTINPQLLNESGEEEGGSIDNRKKTSVDTAFAVNLLTVNAYRKFYGKIFSHQTVNG